MHEMYVSPSLNAISCSQWLLPLITLALNSICLIK